MPRGYFKIKHIYKFVVFKLTDDYFVRHRAFITNSKYVAG